MSHVSTFHTSFGFFSTSQKTSPPDMVCEVLKKRFFSTSFQYLIVMFLTGYFLHKKVIIPHILLEL